MTKKDSRVKTPSVLAFEKKLVPSDGLMYGTTWDDREDWQDREKHAIPLSLQEKSVRGTISNRMKGKEIDKIDAQVQNPNLQTVDNCMLSHQHDTLILSFTLKVLGNIDKPSACNENGWLANYQAVVKKYRENFGFRKLACRYSYNLANGRFLWRNRVGADLVETHVKISDDELLKFNSKDFSLSDFSQNDSLQPLADKIATALSGDNDNFLLLKVTCFARIGKGQEVYPSEELVLDKKSGKGGKSKILYAVDGVAAMHSQKIGNAIRTIDTWHGDDSIGPIAVEPYGSVTNLGKAFRHPNDKKDFYRLFDDWVIKGVEPDEEQQHYVMAVLVRGGVFGESGKKE